MMDDLGYYRKFEFGLTDLVSTAKAILERITPRSVDGRVAAIPDARTVRYYQTVGALNKPLRYEGRSAVYGYLHLLQLIAIKLLQAQGLSLAQIQNALIQRSLKDLETLLNAVISEHGQKSPSSPIDSKQLHRSSPLFMGKIDDEILGICEEPTKGWVPIYERLRKSAARDLIAAEIAPGISVMIDPEKVKDARGILEKIRNILQKNFGELE